MGVGDPFQFGEGAGLQEGRSSGVGSGGSPSKIPYADPAMTAPPAPIVKRRRIVIPGPQVDQTGAAVVDMRSNGFQGRIQSLGLPESNRYSNAARGNRSVGLPNPGARTNSSRRARSRSEGTSSCQAAG
jgi:hypothetical protein